MSTNYTVTRDQVISAALRKCGVLDIGITPDATTVSNVSLVLNLMVKQWMTDGIKLWTVTEYTLPLTANKTSYTIGPSPSYDLNTDRPLKLIQAWIRNTSVSPNIDIPVQTISKQEYNMLGSKFSTGQVNSVFLDPSANFSTVYTFLTPDVYTSTNFALHMVVQRPIQDLNNATDIPDFPVEWMQALVWGLADQIALEYGLPVNHRQEISVKAETYKMQLEDWDVEYASTMFQPDYRTYTK